eukprot:TRINITY_DN37113_c0_g1_i1.p2 TRINITY_DN37113_c0_g1~~TRINITY_DN37113_c0_g1_i1.p2  ORF type:complete len:169 (-),score=27.86 TRINITY_DN37113_c0_g1_i1:254-760(-)
MSFSFFFFFFFLRIRRPPRSTLSSSSAASDVYKRQQLNNMIATEASMNLYDLDIQGLSGVIMRTQAQDLLEEINLMIERAVNGEDTKTNFLQNDDLNEKLKELKFAVDEIYTKRKLIKNNPMVSDIINRGISFQYLIDKPLKTVNDLKMFASVQQAMVYVNDSLTDMN